MDQSEHDHCKSCYKLYCTITPDGYDCCKMVCCDLGCGSRYHQCKQSEHSKLCREERVPCINLVNGCKTTMARSKLGIHLKYCPASVLCCPVEWNRWPLHSQEKGLKMAVPRNTYPVHCNQLDVALALRDQRMLIDSFNAPSQTRHILRNNLTRKYPAAPINHMSSSMESDEIASGETSDDDEAPWKLGRMPPGLQRSICSQINGLKPTSNNMTSFNNHNGVNTESRKHNNICEIVESEIPVYDGCGSSSTEQNISSDVHVENDTLTNSPHNADKCNIELHNILGVDLTIECISKYKSKPTSMYTFLCAQYFRRDEFSAHIKNVHNDIQSGLNGMLEQRCPLAYLGCTYTYRRMRPKSDNCFIIHSALLESFGLCYKEKGSIDPYLCNTNHPQTERPLSGSRSMSGDSTASADIGRKTISRTIPKINTGLSWDSVVDIQISCDQHQEEISDITPFLTLPFELLQSIVHRLDSFSICNVSMTCCLLRDVCCSLLEERGIVTQVWQKKKMTTGEKEIISWNVAYNKWNFSTAFTPIDNWEFMDYPSVSDHLKTCLYNKETIKWTDKFCILPHDYAPKGESLETLLTCTTKLKESSSASSFN